VFNLRLEYTNHIYKISHMLTHTYNHIAYMKQLVHHMT